MGKKAVFWAGLLCLVPVINLMVAAALSAQPKRVLLIHSFGRDIAPFSEYARNFHAELVRQSSEPIDIYEASVYSPRLLNAESDEDALLEYVQSFNAEHKPNLIVSVGAPATNFALKYREMLGSTPLLAVGPAERRLSTERLTDHDASVSLRIDIPEFFKNILRLRPATKDIIFVIGNSPTEQFWLSEVQEKLRSRSGDVKITYTNKYSVSETLQYVANATENTVIWYSFVAVDGAANPQPLDRVYTLIRETAKVPVFGIADYQLGSGIIGGPLLQTRALGRTSAASAIRILNGESPGTLTRAVIEFGAPEYDWRELQKWKITEQSLPAGSIVHFREPTFFQRYWWQILLTSTLLILQTLFIARLLNERRLRATAELEVRRRMSELAVMKRRSVADELSASIAHEINQPLAAIVAGGGAALRWLGLKTPNLSEVRASLERIVHDGRRAADIVGTIRSMFRNEISAKAEIDLNKLVIEALDLFRGEIKEFDVEIKLTKHNQLPSVRGDRVQIQQVLVNIIRNAIEAMRDVVGRDRLLKVDTDIEDAENILVTVEDSGEGIDPSNLNRIFTPFFTTKPDGMGMGLSICRSIIEAHGGRLTVSSEKPRGTVFKIVLPIDQAQRPAHV